MTRDQRRAQRKQARFERSRRTPAAPWGMRREDHRACVRIREILDFPEMHDDQPMPSGIAAIGQYMRAVGCPLPVLTLDRAEIVKDAEVCPVERLNGPTKETP